jgi:hypothetical protein
MTDWIVVFPAQRLILVQELEISSMLSIEKPSALRALTVAASEEPTAKQRTGSETTQPQPCQSQRRVPGCWFLDEISLCGWMSGCSAGDETVVRTQGQYREVESSVVLMGSALTKALRGRCSSGVVVVFDRICTQLRPHQGFS